MQCQACSIDPSFRGWRSPPQPGTSSFVRRGLRAGANERYFTCMGEPSCRSPAIQCLEAGPLFLRMSFGSGVKKLSPIAAASNQRLHCLDQLRDVDRVGEGRVLHMPRRAGQDLFGLTLEQDDMFESQHGAEMRGPRVVLALSDDLDDLCLRRAEIGVRQSGAELAHHDLRLSKQKRLFVEPELVRLDRDKTEGFERLDHCRPIPDISAV